MIRKNSIHIIWLLASLGYTSCFFFLALVIHLPFWITLSITISGTVILYKLLDIPSIKTKQRGTIFGYLELLLFLSGLFLLVNRGFYLSEKYGQWDAWVIWNLHAHFFCFPESWGNIFSSGVSPHPDYPMHLPGIVAFFWKTTGTTSFLIPFAISSLVTIFIPTIIFLELSRKNLVVASMVLLWFVTDDFYIERSLSQYADSLLALMLLASFICADCYTVTKERKFLFFTGIFLGLCTWTKNEGVILFFIFSLFYVPDWIREKRWSAVLLGTLLPFVCLMILKFQYAPANDLVKRQKNIPLARYFEDKSRYELIWKSLKETVHRHFFTHKIALLLYAVTLLIKKQLPRKNMMIITSCLMAYLLIYLITPMDLAWHLETSLSRLLLQLSPSLIYIVGKELSDINVNFINERYRNFKARGQ